MRLLEVGHDVRTVQELLGQRDVSATMIHAHVLHGVRRVRVAQRMRCSVLLASDRCRHGTNCNVDGPCTIAPVFRGAKCDAKLPRESDLPECLHRSVGPV